MEEKQKDPRPIILAAFALLALVIVGIVLISRSGGDDNGGGEEGSETAAKEIEERGKPKVTVEKGAKPPTELVSKEIEEGDGEEAKSGDEVSVQYVGVNYKTGKEFDSSWSRNAEPFSFTLGKGEVIPGWDQGVEGMKVGGRRELIIPPELGYGKAGSPPAIPPNETLVFVIDLEAVN
jgi:peptidylprolyl isomerase